MLHYSKLSVVLLISCMLSDASVFTNLISPITNSNAAKENKKLCSLNTPGLIKYYGYKPKTSKVTTEDGYIIIVHCLWNSTALNRSLNPVIVWHGLAGGSDTFLVNSPDQSLALLLADKGYFVCLPNARGNTYSRGYTNSSRNANIPFGSFWQFSWDEIAEFDVPAVMDAVLDWSGKSKVILVGHSQGTTTMFALLSSKPVYNDKVAILIALAPVVFFSHTTCRPYVIASYLKEIEVLYGFEFLRSTSLKMLFTLIGCTGKTKLFCKNLLFLLSGYTEDYISHLNENKLPVYMCKVSDFAWGQFLLYTQHVRVDTFHRYDFKSQNQRKYGQSSPPQYDLTKVSAPVALFHSDWDTTTADIDILTPV